MTHYLRPPLCQDESMNETTRCVVHTQGKRFHSVVCYTIGIYASGERAVEKIHH